MATAALIGSPVNRVDGRKKVTGSAQYAAEAVFGNMAYGVLVGSAIPSGRIIRIHREEAEKLPGVLLVLTHENRKKLGEMPLGLTSGGSATESRAPLADGEIRYAGQYVAMIVAESLEQARYAADVLQIDYAPEPSAVLMEDAQEWVKPDQEFGQPMQVKR
ncbi:MAG: xanthine dehydrogenase family protein molybdopterin-binding subunit, partial [Acidobacteriaceae bacterium]|nr:xanthine dehydrogenase family protein molybdopterin-binding subunit [Acidobacteriaceae bacterium]